MLHVEALIARLEATLSALPEVKPDLTANNDSVESIGCMKERFERLSEAAAVGTRPRARVIHHFACTGGTIISKCVAAQPNIVLLSEMDPLSVLPLRNVAFAPYDILKQAQTGLRPLARDGVEKTFLAGLRAMHDYLHGCGRRLVVRDHAHSQYCTSVDPGNRPALRDILSKEFDYSGVVTVRHPLDSYLSIMRNKWVMFSPATFEEYCRRYLLFLARHDDLPIIRYEDFVLTPDKAAQRLASLLKISYTEEWREITPIIMVTGDSGRSGVTIKPRSRQAVSSELAREAEESSAYKEVCAKLGYPAETEVSPFELARASEK